MTVTMMVIVAALVIVCLPALAAVAVANLPVELFRHAQASYSWRTIVAMILMLAVGACAYWTPLVRPRRAGGRVSGGWQLNPSSHRRGKVPTLVVVATGVPIVYLSLVSWINLQRLEQVDLGFVPEGVIEFRLPPGKRWASESNRRQLVELRDRVSSMPFVRSASVSLTRPLLPYAFRGTLQIPGSSCSPSTIRTNYVTTDYYSTLGITVLEGRTPDNTHSDGIVISASLARMLRACGLSPVGTRAIVTARTGRIVAIVADTPDSYVGRSPDPMAYFPLRSPIGGSLLVRTSGNVREIVPQLSTLVQQVFVGLPPGGVKPLTNDLSRALRSDRGRTVMMVSYAVVSVLLASLGIAAQQISVLHSRRRADAIRLSLGAEPRLLQYQILRSRMMEFLVGGVAGVSIGLIANLYAMSLFTQMPAVDPRAMVVAMVGFLALGLVVCRMAVRGITDISVAEVLKDV